MKRLLRAIDTAMLGTICLGPAAFALCVLCLNACDAGQPAPKPEPASEPAVDPDSTLREVARECLGVLKLCDDWDPKVMEREAVPYPEYADEEDPKCYLYPHKCQPGLRATAVDAPCKQKFEGCIELVRAASSPTVNHYHRTP